MHTDVPGSHIASRGHSRKRWPRLTIFVAFQAACLAQCFIASRTTDEDIPNAASVLQTSVVPEAIKLLLAIGFHVWQRRARKHAESGHREYYDHVLPAIGHVSQSSLTDDEYISTEHPPVGIPASAAVACGVVAGALVSYYQHNLVVAQKVTESISVGLATSLSTLTTTLLSSVFLLRNSTLLQFQAIILQFSGFCIIQSSIISRSISPSTHTILLAATLSTSLYISFMDFVYVNIHSISLSTVHIIIFASSLAINGIGMARLPALPAHELHSQLFSARILFASVVQALMDLALLAVIYFQDGVSAGVFQSFGSAAYLLGLGVLHLVCTWGLVTGACVLIVGTVVYIATPSQDLYPIVPRRLSVRLVALAALIGVTIWLSFTIHSTDQAAVEDAGVISHLSPLDLLTAAAVACPRRPLSSASYFKGKRMYHAFDDVLLVVFFSHARYDVNLDYYREVYAEFFPNMVFVGPGSRQDSGFANSYDVLVDSYEADEDLSDPTFYKMAGRMAHHMLYTALREHPCYDGYLWAPFDTLLNVPRLQQFDQRYFWYHSPFGQYVHNPALGNELANQNKSRHAPPANVSPDPSLNLTATFRHWGIDWWWGEPHVGANVCMPAFDKAPAAMRGHLASLTNGTRLIGGSADTMYIPGRHRISFMDVLGLFLETDCFLEIATPTALHLVSPPGDPILYVDHWWIWQPPLNATFVQQQWAQGMEVDTFHTFHWGDKGEDGIWRGNPQHIPDVRQLLAGSAERQGIAWTSRAVIDTIPP